MATLRLDSPNPIGKMESPEPQQKTKPRPNRNVSSPGSRGGKYRRVWSNRLHKFYIKYGDAEPRGGVDNDEEGSKIRKPSQQAAGDARLGGGAVLSRVSPETLKELLDGLYLALLRAYRILDEGTGRHHQGRAVTFGRVTPANGEIVTHANHRRSCYLYDKKGNVLRKMTRHLRHDEKVKEFFCYMVARYALERYVDGMKHQQEPAQKAIGTHLEASQDGGSSVLSKVYAELLAETHNPAMAPRLEPEPDVFGSLRDSLTELRDAHRGGRPEGDGAKLWKRLDRAWALLNKAEGIDEEELAKAGPKQMWNRMAPGNAGNRYGSAGGGAVFRLPGRPRGSGQGLTLASAGMPVTAPTSSSGSVPRDKDIPTSDVDWMNHKHLRVGSRVKVQHPYEHVRPIWGRITDIGKHGVQVTDEHGETVNIRWHHIHDLEPAVRNTPQNAYEIARMRIPVEGLAGLLPHQSEAAEKELRRLATPMHSDVIHSGHDDKNKAYSYMFGEKYPIDAVEATRRDIDQDAGMKGLKSNLVDQAIAMRVPVDPDLLRELPFKQIVSIIHHHMNEGENEQSEPTNAA